MIQIHNTLNPLLWDNDVLYPKIKSHLIKIAAAFYKDLKVDAELQDILLTGSSANFNYTPDSDIDLHLLIDFNDISCDAEFTKEFFLDKKSIWNNEHNITIKGRDVEVYVQDVKEPHTSTGVYSLLQSEWLIKPKKSNFFLLQDIDKEELLFKFNHIKDLIDHSIQKKANFNFLKKIKTKISDMRKEGLSSKGETDIKNLVFKELRNNKYIDKLSDAITKDMDKRLSVESFANYHAKK